MPALAELGLSEVHLVGDDLGAGVGFQYAALYPGQVSAYAHLDHPLPGPALTAEQDRSFSWHIAFHQQGQVPEAVVADDVKEYLEQFYPYVAHGGESFGGFELYRTQDQDGADNAAVTTELLAFLDR